MVCKGNGENKEYCDKVIRGVLEQWDEVMYGKTTNQKRKMRLIDARCRNLDVENISCEQCGALGALEIVRKAYECCNVAEYMARKYDIKGEIMIGQESPEEV